MTLTHAAAPQPVLTWIISPWWDLAFLVATPFAILPIVSALVLYWLTPEQLSVLVISFASVGHHLPGFLRAYGERDLFLRFRWRFLLAPPLVFGLVLTSTLMRFHALQLILMLWATWHILMQTYGFMRIYDLKRGRHDRLGTWLDFTVCLAIFAVGMLFSDARMYGLLEVVWLVGLPAPDPRWLVLARYCVAGGATLIFLFYVADGINGWLRNRGMDWMKLVLVISTGTLYWVSGRLAVNMLVGVAFFEVFHAVQYNAIAWFYGRRLTDRKDHVFGPLGFLYQAHWWCGILYLVLIAAYGSLYYLFRQGGGLGMPQLVVAAYTTSALLHFYYDGFIWKVREQRTQVNLRIAGPSRSAMVSSWVHGGKWAVMALIILGLMLLEASSAHQSVDREAAMVGRLADWTPRVPELQSRVSRAALQRGDVPLAVSAARQALYLRPRSHQAHADMGAAWLHAEQFVDAAAEIRQAIHLNPRIWQDHYDLAVAEQACRSWDQAERSYQRADQLKPSDAGIQHAWGEMYVRSKRHSQAMPHLLVAVRLKPLSNEFRSTLVVALGELKKHGEAIQTARIGAELSPNSSASQLLLGRSLIAAGEFIDAADALTIAIGLEPDCGEAHYLLGLVRVQLEQFDLATQALNEALRLEPNHAQTYFQQGNAHYLAGNLPLAADSYRRSTELDPNFADAFNNLGAVLFDLDRLPLAKAAYLHSLELRPANPQAHYNVGLLLLMEGDKQGAGDHFRTAAESGLLPPPDVRRQVGL